MIYCPECGGSMHYISTTKRHVCKSCGLSLTYPELNEMRQKLKPKLEFEEEEHKKRRKEYLNWWLRSKNKK